MQKHRKDLHRSRTNPTNIQSNVTGSTSNHHIDHCNRLQYQQKDTYISMTTKLVRLRKLLREYKA